VQVQKLLKEVESNRTSRQAEAYRTFGDAVLKAVESAARRDKLKRIGHLVAALS